MHDILYSRTTHCTHAAQAEHRAEEAEKKVVQEGSRRAAAESKTTDVEDKVGR
jgi:hypothetical protein